MLLRLAALALLALATLAAPIRLAAEPASAAEIAPSEAAVRLAAAVRERRVVTFRYDGHERRVEPHACGVGSSGAEIVHGFQISGGSASGAGPGWRTFTVEKIADLEVAEDRFTTTRPGYAKSRPRLAPAWAELPAPETTAAE